MTGTSVRVIADSINAEGDRITTVVARYQRFIHAEVMTHKDFSRNASSSRAIPFKTMLKSIWKDMAAPMNWGKNKPGMQAAEELTGFSRWWAKFCWFTTGRIVLVMAYLMNFAGVHKQVINRMIEPWSYIQVQITATNWDRFFDLRIHKDAQPEIYDLARNIRSALRQNKPKHLMIAEWHLPWITEDERRNISLSEDDLRMISAARSARLSYTAHGDPKMDIQKDLKLANMLLESKHMSPFEHQATPRPHQKYANMRGWMNFRTHLND